MAWHLNVLASLHWRCWNNEWAVFDVGSGQTHQMDTLTAVTLMMIDTSPVHFPELLCRVAEELLIPCDQTLSAALSGVLQGLVATGLIETAIS